MLQGSGNLNSYSMAIHCCGREKKDKCKGHKQRTFLKMCIFWTYISVFSLCIFQTVSPWVHEYIFVISWDRPGYQNGKMGLNKR